MTRLVEALHALHLDGEVSLGDRWAKLQGERCWVYVAEAKDGDYYTWCDDRLGDSYNLIHGLAS